MLDNGKKELKQEVSQEKIGRDATTINIDNIDIKNGATLIINKNTYYSISPEISIKKYDEENKKQELENWNKEEDIFSFEDLDTIKKIVDDTEITKTLKSNIKDTIRIFFDSLEPHHKCFFLNALRIIKKEDNLSNKIKDKKDSNIDKEILELIDDIENEEERTSKSLPEDYNKIYNIIRSDDFKLVVIPKLDSLYEKYGDVDKTKQAFLKWWDERLIKHPYAIFVHNQQIKWLISEIIGKIGNNENMPVKVFSRRGERIHKARVACNYIIEKILKGYELEQTSITIGFDKAIIITFVEVKVD